MIVQKYKLDKNYGISKTRNFDEPHFKNYLIVSKSNQLEEMP